jgi:hypothetical protein
MSNWQPQFAKLNTKAKPQIAEMSLKGLGFAGDLQSATYFVTDEKFSLLKNEFQCIVYF